MLANLFPRTADNRYPGRKLGLWLFALMTLKIVMGFNIMVNASSVAQSVDGFPVHSFSQAAAAAFLFLFAVWGLCQLLLGLTSLVVLVRYRSLVPLAFLVLLLEQIGRNLLQLRWPVERVGSSSSIYINAVLLGIMLLGLVLSLWRPRTVKDGA